MRQLWVASWVLGRKARFPLRSAADHPTVAESGVPGFEAVGWNGIVAAEGTPPAIVEQLNKAINAIVEDKAFQQKVIAQGFEPDTMSTGEFRDYIKSEMTKWAKVVKEAHVKVE